MIDHLSDYSARIAEREGRVGEYVRSSSPVLIWQSDKGIYIIAAHKKRAKTKRIFTFLDRFALVTRGTAAAADILATGVASTAWSLVPEWTRALVPAARVEHYISLVIQQELYQFSRPPISAEAVFVEANADLENDHLAYITHRGEEKAFEKALLLGTVDADTDAAAGDEDRSRELQDELRAAWQPEMTLEQILEAVHGLKMLRDRPALSEQLGRGSLETLLLDREAVRKNQIYRVVQRLG